MICHFLQKISFPIKKFDGLLIKKFEQHEIKVRQRIKVLEQQITLLIYDKQNYNSQSTIMSQNHFQDVQAYFCDSQQSLQGAYISREKNEQISTFTSSKDHKLLKNRISAQNSRLKKKKYIEDLERDQKQLIAQIQETQKEIQKTKQDLNVFLTKNKENDSFNHSEKPTYERLASLITQQHFDEDQANMLIELLINRVGVTGKERRRMVDYYSKRMINFSIPAIYRYLLHASTEQKGLLAEENVGIWAWDQALYQAFDLTPEQKQVLIGKKESIAKQKADWVQKISDFEQVKGEIYKTSAKVEQSLLEFKQMLDTRQIGEIIIGIQKRKYNRDIVLGQNDFDGNPSKKIKRE